MKLWVDDIVKAPEGWAWCRGVNGAKAFIETYEKKDDDRDPLTIINVDTDAGSWKSEGGDYIELLKWLETTGRNYRVKIHMKNYPDSYGMVEEMREIIRRNRWDDMDTYLVINGKKVVLTAEQLNALGLAKNRNNPFERVAEGKMYYYVDKNGKVDNFGESGDLLDDNLKNASNYFNDKDFAEQVYLRQLLQRKLLRFAWNYGYEATDEPNQFYVSYFPKTKSYVVVIDCGLCAPCVHFSSYSAAERAIKEVIEPFVKKHPNFVW
jgi:hypothetical protein